MDFYLGPFNIWAGPGSNGRKPKASPTIKRFSLGSVGDGIQSQYILDIHVCHNH